MVKPDGGLVFSRVDYVIRHPPNPNEETEYDVHYDDDYAGLSLRDYFAGQALAGYAARLHVDDKASWPSYGEIARWAYEQADAMLAQREKES